MNRHVITVTIVRDVPWTPGTRTEVKDLITGALTRAGISAVATVAPPDPEPDTRRIEALLAEGTWEPVWGDGTSRMLLDWRLAGALAWECPSCRPDAGWAKTAHARRAADGAIILVVECGHCGTASVHLPDGTEPAA